LGRRTIGRTNKWILLTMWEVGWGEWDRAFLRGTALRAGRSWFRFPVGPLGFFIDIILPAALWLWSRLSLYKK
jgi:hypothetical protein